MTDNVEEKNINDQPVTLLNEDWYILLKEGVLSTVVESNFVAKQTLIEGYHQVGKLVYENIQNFERLGISKKHMIKNICLDLGKPKFTRSLYYAIQFYKKFPDLESFLGSKDKTISWNKIKLEELPEPEPNDLPDMSEKDDEEGTEVKLKLTVPTQPTVKLTWIETSEDKKTDEERQVEKDTNVATGKWQIFIKYEEWDEFDWSEMLKIKDDYGIEFINFLESR